MEENFILPPSLENGDKVAVVGTSSGVQKFPQVLEKGVERLENRFDLQPIVYDTARKDTEYLNSHHKEKAEEVMKAFEDSEIKGLVALTGGTEQIRMLKHLEPERLRDNPTRFYGISDNTNLHIYLWNLGIQSFYGGQILDDLLAEGEIGEYTYKNLEKAFFQDSLGTVKPSENFTDEYFDLFQDEITDDRKRYESPEWEFWNFNGRTVENRLFGGCFEILDWQFSARKYLPGPEKLEDKILAMETSEESPSPTSVKRWLRSMGEGGILNKFSAIIVGRPPRESLHGEEKTIEEKKEYHEEFKEVIKKEVKTYCPQTPVVFDVDFGHTHPKIPLQLGGKVKLDPEKEQLHFR